ncbi:MULTISPECIES: imidazole glycerol phosphate synthase subunit HisH [Kordiimonas]|jgi:glutamine amidotransferase|uniref:imidazole glycerol phosphate synthase subunit HisH n=1 Tax=Kordiimonas TaxID=288021 RepID=UPI00257FB9A6|nr:imidazole glycerol phosphate synthase subunit HisH [Kordiimonas sp. UBA4487]
MGAVHLIVDYGMGNLHSVLGALRYLGVEPIVSGDPADVAKADSLILPGVGSFYKAMAKLEETGLADALREVVLVKNRKILGICLGQQLMAGYSVEDGGRSGLGFFSGSVTRLPRKAGLKVPHVGFNKVRFEQDSRLFSGFGRPVDFYFVHSFRLNVENRPGSTALCNYGEDFVAAYEYENIFCTQFHPEKSQTNGLRLLSNFLAE